MNITIKSITYTLFLSLLSLTGCGGGGGDNSETSSSIGGVDMPVTGISTVSASDTQRFIENVDSALAGNGEFTTEAVCINDGSGFNGCYATDCAVYNGDFGVELGIRDAFTITDTKIIGLKVFYDALDCTGTVRENLSRSISSWLYQFETMSDTRAVVRGEVFDFISIANVSIDNALGFSSGFSLWELQNDGNTLCLSNGPEGTSELFAFEENLADLGTTTSGACATRFSP